MNVTVHAAETTVDTLLHEHLPQLLRTAGDVSAEWALWQPAAPRSARDGTDRLRLTASDLRHATDDSCGQCPHSGWRTVTPSSLDRPPARSPAWWSPTSPGCWPGRTARCCSPTWAPT